jgi:hypothetical protein
MKANGPANVKSGKKRKASTRYRLKSRIHLTEAEPIVFILDGRKARNLQPRLTEEAWLLGFTEHDISTLISAGPLRPVDLEAITVAG